MVGCSPDTIPDDIENRKPIIFCAVDFEANAIRRALPDFPASALYTIGVKAAHLPKKLPPNVVIIMAGLAGGLDPALKVGDVLIDSLSDNLPAELSSLSYARGPIHTADAIVPAPADRAALFKRTGALAVDMENAHVRAFAKRFELPYIGIRAISDCATDILNPAIARFVDDRGRVKPAALAFELVRRPRLGVELNQLRKSSTLAVNNLAVALRILLNHLAR